LSDFLKFACRCVSPHIDKHKKSPGQGSQGRGKIHVKSLQERGARRNGLNDHCIGQRVRYLHTLGFSRRRRDGRPFTYVCACDILCAKFTTQVGTARNPGR
jgi:hypothetical protein